MSETRITRSYDLPAFTSVEIEAGLSAHIDAGEAQAVTATAASEDDLERLNLTVRDGTLHAGLRHEPFGLGWFGHHRIDLSVAAPEIGRVDAGTGSVVTLNAGATPHLKLRSSAGARLDADAIDSERLEATACSGSRLTLSGRCAFAELQSSAGSSLEADGLTAAAMAADSTGGSHVRARATDEATVAASGGARVDVSGNPKRVRQDNDISSSVRIG